MRQRSPSYGEFCLEPEVSGRSSVWEMSEHESSVEFLCGRRIPTLDAPTVFADMDVPVTPQWADNLREAAEKLAGLVEARRKEFGRIASLEHDVTELKRQVGLLRDSQSVVVPIAALEPEPFNLLRDIPVVVQSTDDGFLATFFDANIGMTGDTREEAVANLKVLLVDVFDELDRDEGQLGPQLVRQLAVLRSFMKRRA